MTEAGTEAVRGDYYEYGEINGKKTYKHESESFYIIWSNVVAPLWYIHNSHVSLDPLADYVYYLGQDNSPGPYVGTYTTEFLGSEPDAVVT